MGKNYFEITYHGPFKGLDSQQPSLFIDPASTPFSDNMIYRNVELRPRPKLMQGLPGLGDGSLINYIDTFLDANGVTHTVAISPTGFWQLNRAWAKNLKQAWNLVSPFPAGSGTGLPVTAQIFLNKFFWSVGSNHLWYWDGITSPSPTAPTGFKDAASSTAPAANTTYGGFFLGELNYQLLLLNTLEGVGSSFQSFPQRIRWSASGLPLVWDATVNIGAGFNDMLDVPDSITGFLAIGRSGFVFRSNGITELTAINQGPLPFDFNHLWSSERGIGNVFPATIAGYGPTGIFISSDDVYQLTLGGFEKIGGGALDDLFNDLQNATAAPVASIVPIYQGKFPWLVYMLGIPLNQDSVMWVYDINEKSWTRWFKPQGIYGGPTKFVAVS